MCLYCLGDLSYYRVDTEDFYKLLSGELHYICFVLLCVYVCVIVCVKGNHMPLMSCGGPTRVLNRREKGKPHALGELWGPTRVQTDGRFISIS